MCFVYGADYTARRLVGRLPARSQGRAPRCAPANAWRPVSSPTGAGASLGTRRAWPRSPGQGPGGRRRPGRGRTHPGQGLVEHRRRWEPGELQHLREPGPGVGEHVLEPDIQPLPPGSRTTVARPPSRPGTRGATAVHEFRSQVPRHQEPGGLRPRPPGRPGSEAGRCAAAKRDLAPGSGIAQGWRVRDRLRPASPWALHRDVPNAGSSLGDHLRRWFQRP